MTYPEPSPASDRNAAILALPRFSTWHVFFLSFITLGVYSVYWMRHRSTILVRIHPQDPINRNFMFLSIGVWAFSFVMALTREPPPNPGELPPLFWLQFATAVLFLIWAFLFHARLNRLLRASGLSHQPLNPVLTFLFQAFYLSYKINQNIDLARAAGPGGSTSNRDDPPGGADRSGSMTA